MMYGAFTIRVPPEGWKPEGFDPATLKEKPLVTTANVIVNRFLDAQGKPGTLTAEAHRPALLTKVGVLAAGFLANLLIRPVPERFHEPSEETEQAAVGSVDRRPEADSAPLSAGNLPRACGM